MADDDGSLKSLIGPAAYSTLVVIAQALAQERCESMDAALAELNLEEAYERFREIVPAGGDGAGRGSGARWNRKRGFPPAGHRRDFLRCLDEVVSRANCKHPHLEKLLERSDTKRVVVQGFRMARTMRLPSLRGVVLAALQEAYHRIAHHPPKEPLKGLARYRPTIAKALRSESSAKAYFAFVSRKVKAAVSRPPDQAPSGDVTRRWWFWWGASEAVPPDGYEGMFYAFLRRVMFEERKRHRSGGASAGNDNPAPVDADSTSQESDDEREVDDRTPQSAMLDEENAMYRKQVVVRTYACLTEFEREVWGLRVEECTTEQIAKRLRCSETTVYQADLAIRARGSAVNMAMRAERAEPVPHRTSEQKVICDQLIKGREIGEICVAEELASVRKRIQAEFAPKNGSAANPGPRAEVVKSDDHMDKVRDFVIQEMRKIVALSARRAVSTTEETHA